MKKFPALLFCLLILSSVLFAACGNKQTAPPADSSIIGTWEEDLFRTGYVFEEDGTGKDTFWDLAFTYETEGDKLTITFDDTSYGTSEYTYTLNGDTLTLQLKDSDEAFDYKKK